MNDEATAKPPVRPRGTESAEVRGRAQNAEAEHEALQAAQSLRAPRWKGPAIHIVGGSQTSDSDCPDSGPQTARACSGMFERARWTLPKFSTFFDRYRRVWSDSSLLLARAAMGEAWRADISPGYTSPRAKSLLRPHSSHSQADLREMPPGSPVFRVVDPRVYHERGTFGVAKNFVEREVDKKLEAWQRPRSVGHPQHRLGCYTRASSNRSWLETDLQWQSSMKQVAKERGLLSSSQSSRHTSDTLQMDEQELAEASVEACVQGTPTGLTNMSLAGQEHGSSSFLYDYLGEGLPPSPFSPRNRFSARRDARRGGGGGGGTRPARERSRSTETLSTSISSSTLQSSSSFGALDTAGAWADESSLLTFGSRVSSPSTASAVLSRTQSASAFGTPRPWYLQPKALPRRYGAVRAFGSSPSRFPTPRTSFFGCPSTTRGTYDGSTAHLPGGIWSTR